MEKVTVVAITSDVIEFSNGVMATFGMPTDTTNEYLKTPKQAEKLQK